MVIILWKSNIITTLYVCDVINYLCTITELTVDFWFHTGDERTVHLFILLRSIMSLFILILFTSCLAAAIITTPSQGFHLEMNVSIVCNELLLQVTCVIVFLMRTAEILSVCMQTLLHKLFSCNWHICSADWMNADPTWQEKVSELLF